MNKSKIAFITIITASILALGISLVSNLNKSVYEEFNDYYSKNPALIEGNEELYVALKNVHIEAKLNNCAENKESMECKFIELKRVNLKKKYYEINNASYRYLKAYYKNKLTNDGKFSYMQENAITYFATKALNDNFNSKAYAIVYNSKDGLKSAYNM